jgi:hypothetical protein
MKIIGAIIGISLTAMFLFMIWRLIGTYLPPRKDKDRDKNERN